MYKGKHPKPKPPKSSRPRRPKVPPDKDKTFQVGFEASSYQNLIYRFHSETNVLNVVIPRVRSRTTGGSVIDYRRKISRHESATSSLSGTTFTYRSKRYFGSGSYTPPVPPPPDEDSFRTGTRVGNGDGYSMSSDTPTTPPPYSGASYTSAYNLAVQRLYDTIRELESSTPIGEDVGEYHQTLSLFKRGLGGIRDLIDYVSVNHAKILRKESSWNDAKRISKSLADLTLEYRFGIEPLAKNLGRGIAALQSDKYSDAIIPFSVKGKATSRVQDYDDSWGSFPALHLKTYTETEHLVRFKGEYKIGPPREGYRWNHILGLTWREFLPTLYNLIPYSFLADYVSNLHTFVEAMAVPYSQVAWCVKTERSKTRNVRNYTFVQGDQNVLFTLHGGSVPGYFISEATGVRRSDQVSIPTPIFQWKNPSERAKENILALVAGRLPVIGNLTRRMLSSSNGRNIGSQFRLAVRDRDLRVPYPFHSAS
jgi:hypothetical protein